LKLKSAYSGWYFSGCPLEIEAIPKKGYEFVKWGGLDYTNLKLNIDPEGGIAFYPIFKKKEQSEFKNQIKINEISIKQDSLHKTGGWIELSNLSKKPIDLSNWILTAKGKKAYYFPEGTFIQPQSYLIIVRNREKFQSVFPINDRLLVNKELHFGFSSKKDRIRLFDADIRLVDSLKYDIKKHFSKLEKTKNRALEKTNPVLKSVVNNWKISKESTPGKQNDQFEKIAPKNSRDNWLVIGVFATGIAAIGLLTVFLLRKKKRKFNR